MSADCSETTRLLGRDDAETAETAVRMMGDNSRKEEGSCYFSFLS